MGPVTFQVLDQAGCLGAVALLRKAHRTAVKVCLSAPNADCALIGTGHAVANSFATHRG
jgi:hypothetical protein